VNGNRRDAGLFWEAAAAEFLRTQGLEILIERYRCRLGELDLVCLEGPTLVIVEVRARASSARVDAAESVDLHKRRRIIRATRHLLMRRPHWSDLHLRFDVLAIGGIDTRAPSVRWIKSAFDGT
jgi:putative endonuclease